MNAQLTPPSGNAPQKSFIQRYALTLKVLFIGFLVLLLLIPMGMIQGLIHDREYTAQEAIREVHNKWSGKQMIVGPVLIIPYIIPEKEKRNREYIYIFPEHLKIKGSAQTEELKRGIYEIVVYQAPLELQGRFSPVNTVNLNIPAENLLLHEASLNLGISDLRGIKQQIALRWNDEQMIFNPGVADNNMLLSGISLGIDPQALFNTETPIHFTIDLKLQGSESLSFAPLGKTTEIELNSNCTTPSFDGAFLPENREITNEGFSSRWNILDLNRNYGQIIIGDNSNIKTYNQLAHGLVPANCLSNDKIASSVFGVNLLLPIHQYQKATRSVKYAFLIIILTFVVSFFVEILQKKNIHPFQYLLIGLALCLFYTLLVSTSEHINFSAAYWISTAMTTLLITCYMVAILKIKKTALTIGLLLFALYTYIFFLIQMETYALLAGSIGLFVILAIIMYYSQKITMFAGNYDNR